MATNPNMVAIQTVTVGSGGASSIDFTNIPQTYTDLKLSLSVRSTFSGQLEDQLKIQINGNAVGNAFSLRRLSGDGSSATSSSSTSGWIVNAINAPTSTSNTFTNIELYFPNYAGSNNKSYSVDSVMENNATTAYAFLTAVSWSNTAAITSLKFITNDNFAQHSTATLYGVTSAAVAAKATGGIITSDANYFYHTFLASGTFTPTQSITADYLVVAGGGGGGNNQGGYAGGGGGAGGLRCTVTATGGGGSLESALSLTAQAYTVTVGAGGAASSLGNDSIFSTITSTKGGDGADGISGTPANNGGNGGSGGGGGNAAGTPGTGGTGGTRTANQGFDGGDARNHNSDDNNIQAGGGGGAGLAGGDGGATVGGSGGNGVATSITGSSVTYAGGGAGGSFNQTGGTGGTGGGGNGGQFFTGAGTAGTVNTGGGGGGGGSVATVGGTGGAAGGSGVVIVRYPK